MLVSSDRPATAISLGARATGTASRRGSRQAGGSSGPIRTRFASVPSKIAMGDARGPQGARATAIPPLRPSWQGAPMAVDLSWLPAQFLPTRPIGFNFTV